MSKDLANLIIEYSREPRDVKSLDEVYKLRKYYTDEQERMSGIYNKLYNKFRREFMRKYNNKNILINMDGNMITIRTAEYVHAITWSRLNDVYSYDIYKLCGDEFEEDEFENISITCMLEICGDDDDVKKIIKAWCEENPTIFLYNKYGY